MTALPSSGGSGSDFPPRRQRNIRGAILSSKASFSYDKNTSPFRSSSAILSDGTTPDSPTRRLAGANRKRNFMSDYADSISIEGRAERDGNTQSPSSAPRQISGATSSGELSGPWSEKRSSYRPPPQSQFHFQAPAPSSSLSSAAIDAGIVEGVCATQETSATAFARLAQSQRAQQEANRRHASGLSVNHLRLDSPPAKRRKGMKEALMEGAVSAVIFTGAAAVTAWSLWSSWVKEEGDVAPISRDSSREHLPPGALEEPPPPYLDQNRLSQVDLSHRSSSPGTSSRRSSFLPAKQTHIYVSSRRRRPAFERHRTSKSSTATSSTPSKPQNPNTDDGMDADTPSGSSRTHVDESLGEGTEEIDDSFQRMQSQMALLIEEGKRALHSTHRLEDEDLRKESQSSRMSHTVLSPQQDRSAAAGPFILGSSHPRPYGRT